MCFSHGSCAGCSLVCFNARVDKFKMTHLCANVKSHGAEKKHCVERGEGCVCLCTYVVLPIKFLDSFQV